MCCLGPDRALNEHLLYALRCVRCSLGTVLCNFPNGLGVGVLLPTLQARRLRARDMENGLFAVAAENKIGGRGLVRPGGGGYLRKTTEILWSRAREP